MRDEKLGQALSDSGDKRQESAYDAGWGMGVEKAGHDHRFGLKYPADTHENLIYDKYDEIASFMGLG